MYDEWKVKLKSLSPSEFEELCFSLVQAMGFKNVIWREPGADQGRDIEAEKIEILPDGFSELIQKWFFECKLYEKSIPPEKISSKIDWAEAKRADRLALMSNSHLSNPCRLYLEKREKTIHTKIIEWTGMRFLNILFSQPPVFKTYFPYEEIPPHFLKQVDKEDLVEVVEDRFMSMGLQQNMDLRKVTSEINISSEDPYFFDFVENKILNIPNLTTTARIFILQMMVAILFQKKEFERANRHTETLLLFDEDNEIYLLNKGIILEEMDKIADAQKIFDKIIDKNPKNPLALNNKGHLLEKKGENKRALKYFEMALNYAPNMEIAISNKASVLRKMGKSNEAILYINEKLKHYPNSYILFTTKANTLLDEMDFQSAYECANKAIDINPRYIEAWNIRGAILEHNSNYQFPEKYNLLALEDFKKVADLNQNYELGWTNMLVCFEHLSNQEEIQKILNILKDKFPNKSISLAIRARILRNKGKSEEALEFLKEAISLDKQNLQALLLKCEIYLESNKFNKARRIASSSIKTCYDTNFIYRFYEILGQAYIGLKKEKTAKKYFKKAEENKHNPISLIENQNFK